LLAFLNTILFPTLSKPSGDTQTNTLICKSPVHSCVEFLLQGVLDCEESVPDSAEGDLDELVKETKDNEFTLSRFFFCRLQTNLLFEIRYPERTFFLLKRVCIIYTPPPEV
jgi:hypothetical protein